MAPTADWSEWEREKLTPPSGDGYGLHEDFRDDVAQYAALGCTDWRLTIEWARVEPAEGKLDSDAIDRYRDILSAARDAGLRNWLTLHHTSLPGWYLDDEGGHRDADARGRFWTRHVDRIAEALDEFADGFVPIDDPIGWALRGYGLGSRPPGRSDARAMREAVEGAVLATHDAVRLLSSGHQPVMTAWRADPVHPLPDEDRRTSPEARKAAGRWDELLWGTWLRAHGEGILAIDGRAPKEVPAFVNEVDCVGIVHDHPVGITDEGSIDLWPRKGRRDASGFSPEAGELAEAIHRTHEALPDHEIVVAGHGVPTDDDAWHDDQIGRALDVVLEAADEGRLAGYFHDAGVDGYEWKKGFEAPRGLLRRNRTRRPAASTFADATTTTLPPN
ncbi:MAG: family 1 glycosylhydrolase [Acidimicrobiales bacterium]